MNLQPVTGRPLITWCIRCGAKITAGAGHDVHADLEGIPWKAYYCGACVQVRRAERAAADIVQGPIVEVRP